MKLRKHQRHCRLCGDYFRTVVELVQHLTKHHQWFFCPCDLKRKEAYQRGYAIAWSTREIHDHFVELHQEGAADLWSHILFFLL